jgi:hypothetical protein
MDVVLLSHCDKMILIIEITFPKDKMRKTCNIYGGKGAYELLIILKRKILHVGFRCSWEGTIKTGLKVFNFEDMNFRNGGEPSSCAKTGN